MAAELGHFALILAFCLALTQAFFGLTGLRIAVRTG
jgi:cytochrome c-type biogenesis protein CcmF